MEIDLNDHGQPLDQGLNWKRRRDSRADELIGLCRGILADGVVAAEEASYLADWLSRNEPTHRSQMGRELSVALKSAMVEGKLDPAGEQKLIEVLIKITGGILPKSVDASRSTELPLDIPPPRVVYVDRYFCFTGKFTWGKRRDCETAVMNKGGKIHPDVRLDTSFLVIGEIGSRDWLHSTMGTKIERALYFRERGAQIKIIAESCWCGSLSEANRSI